MRFDRCRITRERRPWTPRRLAAAARAVAREAAAMPLFPELRRYTTAEERVAQMDCRAASWASRFRDFQARTWRDARRRYRALPEPERAKVMARWHRTHFPTPGTSGYFAALVTEAERGWSVAVPSIPSELPNA